MTMNTQGRPTRPASAEARDLVTYSGNRGLDHEEALIFEIGSREKTGVDIAEPKAGKSRLGGLERTGAIGLAGLTEPEAVRHYVRLSRKNYAIDSGLYPLGSCTMKHNPRLNEKMARLPGLGDVHPLQPQSTVQGAIALMERLSHYLLELTGMKAVALSPKAGAHGELCGMMAIKAAHLAKGRNPLTVLVPDSAHGTNPATAALIGYKVKAVPAQADGTVSAAAVKAAIDADTAAIMLTNPNTCGLFEREIVEIAKVIHEAGAYFYCDGANFNAIVGKARPGDLGIDCMHINLHKTFSTPHGGGGPGSGPVVLSEALAPFAPLPLPAVDKSTVPGVSLDALAEHESEVAGSGAKPFGRLTAFHGQMGMFVRALTYMMSHGSDGMRQASEDAVLNANYVRAGLSDLMSLPFGNRPCMHEVLFDDKWLKNTGVTTLDFAKAMIDEGYHPMTMYFPLVVHGAMLIEPTESESKASLDQFVASLRGLAKEALGSNDKSRFREAPVLAPRRRLDETKAAREPRLRWRPAAQNTAAAE